MKRLFGFWFSAVTGLFLISLSACTYDMAAYTRLDPVEPGQEKVALISPNIYGVDNAIYQATRDWVAQMLKAHGYIFNSNKKANVLITIRHEFLSEQKEKAEEEKTQETQAREEMLSSPVYQHHLTLWIDDLSCKRSSFTLNVDLKTRQSDMMKVIPELIESLDQSFIKAQSLSTKATKKISHAL